MNDMTVQRPVIRAVHAAPMASVKNQNEHFESQPTQSDVARPERPTSPLMALVHQWRPASPGALQAYIARQHEGGQSPFEPDVLLAALAQDTIARGRGLDDARNALRSGHAVLPEAETLHSVLSSFNAPPLPLRNLVAYLQQAIVADDEADASVQAEGAQGAGPRSSSSDFLDSIFELINRLDTEWLSRFSDVLGNYVGFFNELTDIMALLADSITGTDNNGNLNVDFSAVRNALDKLVNEIQANNSGGLGGNFASHEEADAFLKDLGLRDLVIRPNRDGGGWQLAIDVTLVIRLRDMFTAGPHKISPAEHAALISAKDSLLERFNHINRVLPDKYQRQLQMWDTLVKTLSGTIDSMADTNKLIMQNMA